MCSKINYISFFQSLKVLTINVGTLPSLAACSTQDKKLVRVRVRVKVRD
jgi:hypothetical protein